MSAEEIRWEVSADQIDPDRWARAIMKALAGGKTQGDNHRVTRWGFWPAAVMVVLLLVALAALSGSWTLIVAFSPAVLIIGGLFALNRATTSRLAGRIRSTPSVREPFSFTADASGTRSTSMSGAEQLAWTRYRNVSVDDDLVLLRLDNDSIRVLPMAALRPGQSDDRVVAKIRGWIDAAHSDTPSQGAKRP